MLVVLRTSSRCVYVALSFVLGCLPFAQISQNDKARSTEGPADLRLTSSTSKRAHRGQKIKITMTLTNHGAKPYLVCLHPGLVGVNRSPIPKESDYSLIDQGAVQAITPDDLRILQPKQSVSLAIERVVAPKLKPQRYAFESMLSPLDIRRAPQPVRAKALRILKTPGMQNGLNQRLKSMPYTVDFSLPRGA